MHLPLVFSFQVKFLYPFSFICFLSPQRLADTFLFCEESGGPSEFSFHPDSKYHFLVGQFTFLYKTLSLSAPYVFYSAFAHSHPFYVVCSLSSPSVSLATFLHSALSIVSYSVMRNTTLQKNCLFTFSCYRY